MKRQWLDKWVAFGVGITLTLFFAGCATPKAQFVLLSEPDGHVGQIHVTNEAGTTEIAAEHASIRVAAAGRAPQPGKTLDPAQIEARYGRTLDFLPAPPVAFNVHFLAGTAQLAPGSEQELVRVLEEVRARDSRDISLNGHTDTVGSPQTNMALSLDRAETVRKQLVEAGVPAEYFTVEYYGESDPVVPTADEVDEAANRRVEIVVR